MLVVGVQAQEPAVRCVQRALTLEPKWFPLCMLMCLPDKLGAPAYSLTQVAQDQPLPAVFRGITALHH